MSSKDVKIRAEDVLGERWRRHTESLHRHLPVGLAGDDERDPRDAVDAIGRLRSWIVTWHPLIDDPRVEAVDTGLAGAQAALARVADIDSMRATLTEAADRAAFAQLASSSLHRELIHRRHSAQVQARTCVDAAKLLDDVEMVNGTIQFRPEAGKRAVRVMPPLAKARWRHLLRQVEALPDPVTPTALSPVGAATAACRDGALDLAVAAGKPARKYAKAMNRLHGHLADMERAVMTADFLDHRGRVGGPTSATNAGLLRGITLAAIADGLDRWPGWWADANRKKLRSWW